MLDSTKSSMVISGADLLKCRQKKQTKRGRPYKNTKISDEELLIHLREEYFIKEKSRVTTHNVDKIKDFTKGTVIDSTKLVLLDNSRITVLPHMGIRSNGGKCLFPEETLLMMHKGRLMVYYEELCLSMQSTLSSLFKDQDLKAYIVYNNLAKFALKLHIIKPLEDSQNINRETENSNTILTSLKRSRSDLECIPKTKVIILEETPINAITSTSSTRKKSHDCDAKLDFDLCWDYLTNSNEAILKKFRKQRNNEGHAASKYSAFLEFPSLAHSSLMTICHYSLLTDYWSGLASKKYTVNEINFCQNPKNGVCNSDDSSVQQKSQSQIRGQNKPRLTKFAFAFPRSLSTSTVKASQSWTEYNLANEYLLKEKLKCPLSSEIIWKGKTKPLNYNYRNNISMNVESTEREDGCLENSSFMCVRPYCDVYNRSCKYSCSKRPPPLARIFISKESMLPLHQLIGSTCDNSMSVFASCSNSFRLLSMFKYRTSNDV